MMDTGDSCPGAQWETLDLHEKLKKTRRILMYFDGARRVSCLGAPAWILWVRDETGSFEKIHNGGRVLRNISAMTARTGGSANGH